LGENNQTERETVGGSSKKTAAQYIRAYHCFLHCFVAQVVAAMLPPGRWGPHAGSREGFDNLSESPRSQPFNPFLERL
jgi:hypothetical protein